MIFLPQLVLAVGVLAVSSAAIIIRLAGEAPPLAIGVYRLAVASLVVLPGAQLVAPGALAAYTRRTLSGAVLSGLFLALHFAFWITSLGYTSVASSVVLVTTAPLFVAPISHWLTGDRVSWRMVLGILVALGGTAVIAFGAAGADPGALLGNGLALLGAATVAGHHLMGRRLLRELPVAAYISVVYPTAALALFVAALASGGPLAGYAPETYGYLVLLALIPQVLGHSSLNWSLSRLSAVAVSTAVMAEPVGATLLALLLLGEAPRPTELLGGAIVLAGVYVALRGERPRAPSAPADVILARSAAGKRAKNHTEPS